MAKRFTDTDKWKDEWYLDLPNDYKIVWQYLLDNCDHAGIYKRNIKQLNFSCNTNITEAELLNVFQKRLTVVADDKWIINKFCSFQYGDNFLNNKRNKAIDSAINILNNLDLIKDNGKGYLTLSLPLTKCYLTPKDKDQDKGQDKNKDKEKEFDKVFGEYIN